MAADKQQNNQQKRADSSLARFSKIPLVEFTVVLSLSAYAKVKSSSEMLTNVLNRAEEIATVAIVSLRPVVNRFEKQINYIDSLGNVVLDKMETIVPSVIKFNPKNAYANTSNRLIRLKSSGSAKLNQIRSFNLAQTVNGGLKLVDGYVDEWLPGTEEENNENKQVEDSVTGQLYSTFGKLRRRSYRKVQNVQRLMF